jgi:hypothetical protein
MAALASRPGIMQNGSYMQINGFDRLIPIAAMAFLGVVGPVWAATGTISANPNPCEIAPGAHDCTTYVTWSTEGVQHARVYVQAEGKGGTPEREFGAETACAKCGASWIEAGARYIFTLVDFSTGSRGAVLATVTVTALNGPAAGADGRSGVINAAPNPCRIPPGKVDCTTVLSWSTIGAEHARVYVTVEGGKPSPEREFGTGRSCEKCTASWIAEGSRYLFTLYDWSTGNRGRALASVVVTAIK